MKEFSYLQWIRAIYPSETLFHLLSTEERIRTKLVRKYDRWLSLAWTHSKPLCNQLVPNSTHFINVSAWNNGINSARIRNMVEIFAHTHTHECIHTYSCPGLQWSDFFNELMCILAVWQLVLANSEQIKQIKIKAIIITHSDSVLLDFFWESLRCEAFEPIFWVACFRININRTGILDDKKQRQLLVKKTPAWEPPLASNHLWGNLTGCDDLKLTVRDSRSYSLATNVYRWWCYKQILKPTD